MFISQQSSSSLWQSFSTLKINHPFLRAIPELAPLLTIQDIAIRDGDENTLLHLLAEDAECKLLMSLLV